jgi:filamentous hemagglutinin
MNTFKAEAITAMVRRRLYGKGMSRTPLFKAITGILAFQMFFFGMAPVALALPGGLTGDSRISTSGDGKTMNIDTSLGANAGRNFNWSSFGIASGELVDIKGVSVHTAPSANIAGRLTSDSTLVLKTTGGNILISGNVSAPSFFAATFSGFDYESMHFTASQVSSGDINVSGSIPGNSVLVGNTVSKAGAAGTVVATSGMTGTSDITIASGGGKITFSGDVGGGILKAGTVDFTDGSSTGSASGGEVTADDEITGNFTQNGGNVKADTVSGTLTQKGGTANATTITALTQDSGNGSATATTIGSLTQTAAGATAKASEVTGNATVAGTLNGNGGLTVGSLTQSGGSVAAGGMLTINGTASQTAGSSITANGVTLDAGTANVSLNQAGNRLGTVSGTAGNVTVNGSSLAVNNLTANGVLTLQNAANASGNISANTISATTLTQSSGTITTKEISGTVVQNGGKIQASSETDGLTLSQAITTQNGTLDGNGGNITLANGSTLSGTVNANTLSGNFTQGGGTISAKTVSGMVTQNGGKIQARDATEGLTLSQTITTQKGALDGNGGDVTLANGSTLSGTVTANTLNGDFTQSAGSTINATTVAGTVTQNGGTIQANNSTDGLTLSQAITTQKGTLDGNGGNVTLANGSTLSGTVNADTLNGNFTQEGGTITATTVAGTVEQDAGTIKNDNGSLTFQSAVTKNAGTIGVSGQNVTFNDDVTQDGSGKIIGNTVTAMGNIVQTAGSGVEAESLNLRAASQEYKLTGGANNVATLYGMTTAKSIEIDNGTHNLTIGKTADGNRYGISTTDGLTIKKAGAVTDGGSSVVNGTIKIDASTSVTLDDSTALSIAGITSSGKVSIDTKTSVLEPTSVTLSGAISSTAGGDVGIKTQSFTQNGNEISGKNVTILGTGANGVTVDGNITASDGDILLKSETGDITTGTPTLSATKGGVVLQGMGVAVNGTTFTSKNGVGMEATGDGKTLSVENANITGSKVVLKSANNIEIKDGVAMGKTTATAKDADLTVSAGGQLTLALDETHRPTKSVRIAKATSYDPGTDAISLETFAIKSGDALNLTFTEDTKNISVESENSVTVTTVGDVTIINNKRDDEGASVSAKNVVNEEDSPVQIAIGQDPSEAAQGLIGSTVSFTAGGKVTVANKAIVQTADDKLVIDTTAANAAIDVQQGALVQSAKGVELKAGDALMVAGTVRDYAVDSTTGAETTDNVGVTLSSGNGKDAAVSGFASARGALVINAAKDARISGTADTRKTLDVTAENDVVLSGSVSASDATTITAKENVKQTGGTVVATTTLDMTATNGDIDQTGGTVTAKGAATAKAENGSVKLPQAGNDFQSGLDVTAKNEVNVRDRDALTLSVAGDTTGDVRAQAGQTLVVSSDIDAGGKVTLLSGNHMEAKSVKADKSVQTTSTANGAVFSGDVEAGTTATLTATGANADLEIQAVTANGGSATLTGASVTTAGDVTANGANSDVAVNATAGAASFGGAVTAGRDVNINATAGADTTAGEVTAARNATIAAGNGAAQVAAVTANNGNATLRGQSVTTEGAVTATGHKATLQATGGAVTVGGEVNAGNVQIEATAGVNENASVNATQAKSVHTTGGNITVAGGAGFTAPTAVYKAESENSTVTIGPNIAGTQNLGIQGGTIVNNGTISGVNNLALYTTGNTPVTYDDATLPANVQNLGLRANGNITVNVNNGITANGATVSANDVDVTANGIVSDNGAAAVNANGAVTASSITGAAGTTVTANGGTVIVDGALGNGDDTIVTADGAVTAGTIVGGTVNVTAGGVVTANGGIIGQNGTIVTAAGIEAGGANVGQGGVTTLTTGGGAINAGTLASGGLLDVNAGAVTANIAAGGNSTIQAASLQSANTAAGGNLTFDNVAGQANVGQLNVNGDMNGTVGQFTTDGGNVGSIGQQGGFNANGITINNALNSGAVTVTQGGAVVIDGSLNAGGNPVTINATSTTINGGGLTGGAVTINGGPVTGGGLLAANNQLIINAGNGEINLSNVQTPYFNNIVGGEVTLTSQQGGTVRIGTITANGNTLTLVFNNADQIVDGGGAGLSAGNTIDLTVNGGEFGSATAPITITLPPGGTLIIGGTAPESMLHFLLTNDTLLPTDIEIIYNVTAGTAFALWRNSSGGWMIVGTTRESQRLINRALAFSVNTPELKSKQGVFGDPTMLHTRMNVSETRPGVNMDLLALKSVDFSETWTKIIEADLNGWMPTVTPSDMPLQPKMEALASEVQLQPEIKPARVKKDITAQTNP